MPPIPVDPVRERMEHMGNRLDGGCERASEFGSKVIILQTAKVASSKSYRITNAYSRHCRFSRPLLAHVFAWRKPLQTKWNENPMHKVYANNGRIPASCRFDGRASHVQLLAQHTLPFVKSIPICLLLLWGYCVCAPIEPDLNVPLRIISHSDARVGAFAAFEKALKLKSQWLSGSVLGALWPV